MRKVASIGSLKVIAVVLLIGAAHLAIGSSSGSTNKRSNNLFSLKYFNKNFHKYGASLSLGSNLLFRSGNVVNQQKNVKGDLTLNTITRFERGNVTYIYPYTHKVTVPKFKTPTPQASFR